jgi:sugar lactone lactonase YvrE
MMEVPVSLRSRRSEARPVRAGGLAVAGLMLVGAVLLVGAGCSGGGSGLTVTVSTLAGSGTAGTVDGTGAAAQFNNPVNVARGPDGRLYVCDFDNNRVRRVTRAGVVTTLVNQAGFERPFGIIFTPDGRLFVQTDADDTGARDATTGTIWSLNLTTGAATVAVRDIGRPRGLAALADNRIVLMDLVAATVRILNPETTAITDLAGQAGSTGFADATGAAARFDRPYGGARMPDGSILLADQNNNRLRRVTLAGVVTTFAGDGTAGSLDGPRLTARFDHPQDVAIDDAGIIYVADTAGKRIRRISTGGSVTTIAGDGTAGFRDGAGLSAEFFGLEGFDVAPFGGELYVADGTGGEDNPHHRVRLVTMR